ncbi:MAG: phage holin family protein [Lacibacter sp.]
MDETFAKAEDLAGHIKEYVNNRISYAKFTGAEKSSKLASNILAAVIVLVVFVFFLLFASLALAFVFSRITGELYWGFLIVSGIYLLAALIVWGFKERLLRIPIMNAILEQLFKDDDNDEED